MDDISAWLANPASIEEGRRLYNLYAPRYRPDDVLSYQINEFSNEVTRDVLRQELEAILPMVTRAKAPTEKTSMKFHKRGDTADLPPDLAALDAEIPSLYKKRDAYRYKMRETEPGRDLMLLALEAVSYDQEIRRRLKILDFFKHTGLYPPEMNPEAEKTEIEKLTYWLRAQRSYPRWILRNKNNPDKATELARRTKVLEEINQYLMDADQKR